MLEKVKEPMKDLKIYLLTIVLFVAGFLLSRNHNYILSGIVILLLAAFLYFYYFYKDGFNLLDMRAVFSLAWIGGMGLSCLKLSHLQKDWHSITWVCFYLAYITFILSYEYLGKWIGRNRVKAEKIVGEEMEPGPEKYEKGLTFCIRIVTVLSVAAFVLEAIVLRYIPVFSSKPEAYSEFHISGIHYFTVSCMLVFPLAVIYFALFRPGKKRKIIELSVESFLTLLIPVLIVSRSLLIMTVFMAGFCILTLFDRIKIGYLVLGGVVFVGLYVFITVSRNHGVDYLNSIYQMKNAVPIFISQPYIYIANNYDNFNVMVENIAQHSYGIRSLAPVFALTGLKFVLHIPSFPEYRTITELTTRTYLYDVYYDFGIAGIIGLSVLLGFISSRLKVIRGKSYNPIRYMELGLMTYLLLFSFFEPWFSNPTIWFYFCAMVAMHIAVRYLGKAATNSPKLKV
ncbi:O-antigen polymerase [Parasporobacterium paucivorans]|uniref:Oligosaccharide repeat unit polymerase n=1 Tax=Parasporobacterium paucivorans DSM 15970 TaxID=1122934 RepID=A0A1M6H648_9FIRM|nr:O-antigen polymerase [Parasporobacterium paucivorans]SHJ17633.1 oligosaccharide repeat unit polymerase [Parasporobacterium paucivorans DSM 15970]